VRQAKELKFFWQNIFSDSQLSRHHSKNVMVMLGMNICLILLLLQLALAIQEVKQTPESVETPVAGEFSKDSLLASMRRHWRSNIDSVLFYANLLRQYATLKGDREAEAEALDAISYAYERQAKYDTALTIRQTVLQIWQSLGNPTKVAWSYHSLGNIYDYFGMPDAALSYHFKALYLRDSLNNLQDVSWSYNRIGEIYSSQMKCDLALQYQQHALQICERLGYLQGLASIHNGLAQTFFYCNQLSKAAYHANMALAFAEKIGDTFHKATALRMLGDVEMKKDVLESAKNYYTQALAFYKQMNMMKFIADVSISLGRMYLKQGNFELALKNASQAIEMATRIQAKKEEKEAYLLLSEIAAAKGDFKQAYAFQEQYLLLRDQILSEERERNIAYLEQQFESRRKDQMVKTLEAEKAAEKESRLIISVLSGLAIGSSLLAVGLLLVLVRRRKREAEEAEKRAEVYERMARVQAELRSEAEMAQANLAIERQELEKANAALEQALAHLAEKRDEAERAREIALEANRSLAEALSIVERQRDELVEQRKIAEEASAFKTELLGMAAHDLKNPLQVVIGYAQLLKEQKSAEDYAAKIEDAARHMLSLIQALLESAAAETGKLKLELKVVDVSQLVKLVVEFNRERARLKNQTIHCNAQPECYACIDTNRFGEAIENLISNAIKYSPEGKNIWITVQKVALEKSHWRRKEDWAQPLPSQELVEIAVRDEGQGISAEDMPKLFGKFQKLSARPTGGESSTGLGLAIVKQLVELHGGKVWAESKGESLGTTFFITLPAVGNKESKFISSPEQALQHGRTETTNVTQSSNY
jgi:signal transduction histidine kinase/tetratricopeptide (TPR) repeat protein